jgi:hypothetical protein
MTRGRKRKKPLTTEQLLEKQRVDREFRRSAFLHAHYTKIPRPLVAGTLYGNVSPQMYSMWAWAVGRSIIDSNVWDGHRKIPHVKYYGCVVPRFGLGTQESLSKTAKMLNDRRDECGIQYVCPWTRTIERVPLVLYAGWEEKPYAVNQAASEGKKGVRFEGKLSRPGLRIEFDPQVLKLAWNYTVGYALVSMYHLQKLKPVGAQRLYGLVAMMADVRNGDLMRTGRWICTPEHLADLMGMTGARKGNVDTAIQQAMTYIHARCPAGKWNRHTQFSAVYKKNKLVHYEFEAVDRRVDISHTGIVPEQYHEAGKFKTFPPDATGCIRRQIRRIDKGRRRKKPVIRDREYERNFEATKQRFKMTGKPWDLPCTYQEVDSVHENLDVLKRLDNEEATAAGRLVPYPDLVEDDKLDAELELMWPGWKRAPRF